MNSPMIAGRALGLAALVFAAACGPTLGGGGGYFPAASQSGGVAGSPCNPQVTAEGCLTVAGTPTRMTCATTTWAVAEACAAGQICVETPGAGTQKTTACQLPAGPDTTSGQDAAASQDAGADSTIASDSAAPEDAAVAKDVPPTPGDAAVQDGLPPADTFIADTGPSDIAATDTAKPDATKPDTAPQDTSPQDTSIVDGQVTAVCGNGKCESGENATGCPSDCQAGPVCGDGKCDGGETGSSCAKDCPTSANSCVGKCGQYKAEWACQCDAQCAGAGDCCPDLASVCSSGTPVCGNAKCEAGETTTNCPADCKTTSGGSCNGNCGKTTAFNGCYCDSQCAQSNDCCADYKTYCGGTTTCGNGKCDAGESTSCPSDCSTSSMCPNAKCEPGETEQSCPQDCKLGCFGDFSLGSTFFKSNDPKQLGAVCNPKGAPKNCPDGYWITLNDTGECACIMSCAIIQVTVGQNCTTDGKWKCQDIKATNADANGGKFCVPMSLKLCTK